MAEESPGSQLPARAIEEREAILRIISRISEIKKTSMLTRELISVSHELIRRLDLLLKS
jgi:hypothetical protein